jgi:hypothetical protein
MRRRWLLAAVLLTGCPLVTKFDRYDTTLTTDGGTSNVAIALSVSLVHVRTNEPATVTVTLTRANANVGASLSVTDLPAGVVADPARVEAGATSADLSLHFAPNVDPQVAASLLGKSVTSNVVATLDSETDANATAAFTLEIWGPPGSVDPLRTATVAFPRNDAYNGLIGSTIATRAGTFIGQDLAIATTGALFRVTPGKDPVTLPVNLPGAITVTGVTIAGYDGGVNVAASGFTTSISTITSLTHGPLDGLSTGAAQALGTLCLVDAGATRAICQGSATGNTATAVLYAITAGTTTSGKALAVYPNVRITSIVSTPRGWLLGGAHIGASGPDAFYMSLVNASGGPVAGFSFTSNTSSNSVILDVALSGDAFIVTGAADEGNGPTAVVRRYLASGAIDTAFAKAGTFTPPTVMQLGLLLTASDAGMLLATRTSTGETALLRLDPTTGALDTTFGMNGTTHFSGTLDPIAMALLPDRIAVATLTTQGAERFELFP